MKRHRCENEGLSTSDSGHIEKWILIIKAKMNFTSTMVETFSCGGVDVLTLPHLRRTRRYQTNAHIYVGVQRYIYTYGCIGMRIHIYMRADIHVYIKRKKVYIHVCVYIYIYIYIYIYRERERERERE